MEYRIWIAAPLGNLSACHGEIFGGNPVEQALAQHLAQPSAPDFRGSLASQTARMIGARRRERLGDALAFVRYRMNHSGRPSVWTMRETEIALQLMLQLFGPR